MQGDSFPPPHGNAPSPMSLRVSDSMERRIRRLLRACLLPFTAWRSVRSPGRSASAGASLDPTVPTPRLAPEVRAEVDRLVAARTAELLRANADLAESKERADEVLRARSDSLAGLSHEIRTPMNAVIGMANVLLSTDLSSKQRALADRILRSSESLLHLLNDFLDFSRIESGKIELERIEFSPREVLEECLDLLTQTAQSKGLDLGMWVDPQVPESVIGDPGRLRQILVNLISNAVKFTQRGWISVELISSPTPGNAARMEFRVRDSGIGIPEEKLVTLFQPYVQADASMARKFGGCGLGLAISKNLCDLMGGDITVTSHPDQGSTFTLALSFEPTAGTVRCGEHFSDALRGTRALLVHADVPSARILIRQLEGFGCRVQHERSVRAALASLHAGEAHDFTLFDAAIPGGGELSALQGDRSALAAGKLVRLVDFFGPESAAGGPSPAIAEIGKPVKVLELIDALTHARGLPPARRLAARSVEQPRVELLETRIRRRIRILVAEDEPSNQEILRWLLNRRSYQLEIVSNGVDAIDAFRSRPPDLVLMDVRMPGLDGLEATRAIRQLEGPLGSRAPILALTASALLEDREHCQAAGMDDFITKPFRPSDLQERVDSWLWSRLKEQPELLRDMIVPTPPRASGPGALARSDLPAMLESADEGGRELALSLVADFLERAPRLLGELEHAVARADHARTAELAHRFVSTAGNVGAHQLVASLRTLEAACKDRVAAVLDSALLRVRVELEQGILALHDLPGGQQRRA